MDVNQNDIVTKINEQMNFYRAHNTIQPVFSRLNSEDRKARKEENEKLESILSAVDNSKTNNPNDNQTNLNGNYTNAETNNNEEKPSLLSRISSKLSTPWVKYPLIITGVGILASQVSCGGIVTPDQESILLDNVTYIPGVGYGCAATVTCMDINYVGGFNFTIKEVYDSGVVNNESQILKFAWDLGFEAKNRQLSIDEIINSLKKSYPVIVRNKLSLNNDAPHSSLVIGIDKKEKIVTTHDPNTVFGAYYERSFDEFEALSLSSQQGKYDAIVIYKGPEPWK